MREQERFWHDMSWDEAFVEAREYISTNTALAILYDLLPWINGEAMGPGEPDPNALSAALAIWRLYTDTGTAKARQEIRSNWSAWRTVYQVLVEHDPTIGGPRP